MSKKNSGADEPQTVLQKDAETNASQEPKADEPKADESKADEPKADEDYVGEANEMDEHEAEAQDIMRKHDKKELWMSGDGYWFSVKDLAEYHAKTKQTTLNHYTHAS